MIALVRSLTLMTLAASLLAGCGSVEQFLPGQQEARHAAEQSHDLQLRVMEFADRYAGRTKDALLDFQGSPDDRLRAQTWKLQQVQAAYTIASGPNPVSNALDMVVLASLSNMVVNDWPVTQRYGDRVRPLQQAHREMERQAWGLVKGVLTDAQTAQLHNIIINWRRENPGFRSVAYIRFNDLAKSTGAREAAAAGPGAESSLFSVLGLDPLTELDPAVREIAQSRQLAERSIYYFQHVPNLLDMQAEQFTDQVAAMPETKSLLASVDRASLVGDASERMVQSLPEILDREREALLAQLMQGFDERTGEIGTLSDNVRSTLVVGTETANAVHATLETVDRISTKKADTSRPFDIREYSEAADKAAVAAHELGVLAERADIVVPALRQATDETADRLERIINHLFLDLLALILAAVAASLLAVLVYRAVVARVEKRDTGARAAR
ncbi:MAG TPA: hypothetical protein VMA53_02845 [Stellaceae bacterium]|nr:hypothetical protein [Stellaceae bacterium]